jgi:hypothetical protein
MRLTATMQAELQEERGADPRHLAAISPPGPKPRAFTSGV